MAYLMHKLFKNKSTQRFILSLKTSQHQHRLSKLSPSLISQQTHHFSLIQPKNSLENDKSTEPLKLYPSFPFGYLLNPVSSIGFDPMAIMEVEEGEAETEDDNTGKVWADSVKKKRKRKRKMNKHKYKKLRKRLRRKT